MRVRDLVFGGDSVEAPAAGVGLAILRVLPMALLVVLHGLGKVPPPAGLIDRIADMGFPLSLLFAWLVAFAETVAPLLVAVGLLTRPAALIVLVNFLVVVFVAHAGDPLTSRELPMLFGAIALTLAFTGAGRYSLDELIRRRTKSARGPSAKSST